MKNSLIWKRLDFIGISEIILRLFMGLLAKLFGGNRNKRLAEWGKSISLNEAQRLTMRELWYAAQRKEVPSVDPLSKLSKDDLAYILKITGASFRPAEFGNAGTLRLAAWRYFKDIGFSSEQAAVIVGMQFNMVGRPDL
ncbi:MAG TPA: hypothetical protein VF604_15655 [Pyrinomonadaceae bacterium]